MAPAKADRSHSRGLGLSLHEVVQRFAAPDVDALNPGVRVEFSRHLTGKHKQGKQMFLSLESHLRQERARGRAQGQR